MPRIILLWIDSFLIVALVVIAVDLEVLAMVVVVVVTMVVLVAVVKSVNLTRPDQGCN